MGDSIEGQVLGNLMKIKGKIQAQGDLKTAPLGERSAIDRHMLWQFGQRDAKLGDAYKINSSAQPVSAPSEDKSSPLLHYLVLDGKTVGVKEPKDPHYFNPADDLQKVKAEEARRKVEQARKQPPVR